MYGGKFIYCCGGRGGAYFEPVMGVETRVLLSNIIYMYTSAICASAVFSSDSLLFKFHGLVFSMLN